MTEISMMTLTPQLRKIAIKKRACAFQALKRTFMHVSGLPPPYFDNKIFL